LRWDMRNKITWKRSLAHITELPQILNSGFVVSTVTVLKSLSHSWTGSWTWSVKS
jgi:hypothetical protein